MEDKKMPECTEYSITDDPDRTNPAHCPKCKGFLKWVDTDDGDMQPVCNKCHAPLVTIPDADSTEDCEWGKICVLKPLGDAKLTEPKT